MSKVNLFYYCFTQKYCSSGYFIQNGLSDVPWASLYVELLEQIFGELHTILNVGYIRTVLLSCYLSNLIYCYAYRLRELVDRHRQATPTLPPYWVMALTALLVATNYEYVKLWRIRSRMSLMHSSVRPLAHQKPIAGLSLPGYLASCSLKMASLSFLLRQ